MDVFFFPEDFVPEDFILIRAPTMGSTGYSGWNNFQVWTFLKFWSWVPPDRAPTTPSTWLNSFQWMDGFFFSPEDFILIRAPTMGSTGYSGWNIFQGWTFLKFWSWVPPGRAPTTPSTWLNSFQWMDGFLFSIFPEDFPC